MTDSSDVNERAVLLPEEQAAGSEAPTDQAEAILEESRERTENEAVGIREDNVASDTADEPESEARRPGSA